MGKPCIFVSMEEKTVPQDPLIQVDNDQGKSVGKENPDKNCYKILGESRICCKIVFLYIVVDIKKLFFENK